MPEHLSRESLRDVEAAMLVGAIGLALKDKSSYHTVIVKSTVIPKTTSDVVKPIIEKYSKKNVGLI